MKEWQKAIEQHLERLGCRMEWVHLSQGSVFLLAWKGKEVQVVFIDLKNTVRGASTGDVREEFLALISHLIRESSWEKIFKGRDVLFKWLNLEEPSENEKKTLALAGVEPFLLPGFWEGGESEAEQGS